MAPAQEYHPELLSRRGELVAWIAASITLVGWLILQFTGTHVYFGLKILAVLLVLAALAISLGNWMDRQTLLRLEPDSIHFQNGLRKVTLKWEAILHVEVIPTTWGNKVRVLGEQSHFDFRTLGVVTLQNEVKGRLGFEKGTEILETILAKAHLEETEGPEKDYLYYARK
jgi:hypothetical protein